jgi:exonuclease VII large subunit
MFVLVIGSDDEEFLMVGEPDNLVLQILREIRGAQTEHSRVLTEHSRYHAEHKQAFSEIRDELKSVNNNAVYAAGFAVLGRRDNEVAIDRVTKLESRVQRIEEKLDI